MRTRNSDSMVINMRLPSKSGKRLKRLATRHGWTASDTSARLVEEGLRRADFAFVDFRDTAVGRQACIQGTHWPCGRLWCWRTIITMTFQKWPSIWVGRRPGPGGV